jgi:hypothetical protein
VKRHVLSDKVRRRPGMETQFATKENQWEVTIKAGVARQFWALSYLNSLILSVHISI